MPQTDASPTHHNLCLTAMACLLAAMTPAAQAANLRAEVVAQALEHPWGLAFMPDGRFLVTERPGRLRLVQADGRVGAPVAGVPAVAAQGQGGCWTW